MNVVTHCQLLVKVKSEHSSVDSRLFRRTIVDVRYEPSPQLTFN